MKAGSITYAARRSRLCIAVLGLALLVPLATAAAGPTPLVLPDLVADPPANRHLQAYTPINGESRLLLRFDGFIHNQGDGALEMRASQPVAGEMTQTAQRIYDAGSGFTDDSSRNPQILFETADGHDHWHLKNAARYSLWNSSQSAEVAPAMKTGFCLGDVERVDDNGPAQSAYSTSQIQFCKQHQPAVASLFEGISAGWRDVYNWQLAFQWVDVSAVQPGVYRLAGEVDPDDVMIESDETNGGAVFSDAPSVVPGHLASAVDAGVVANDEPTAIGLSADAFGTPGPRRFKIESPPAHGTLSQPVGSAFADSSVVYMPNDPNYTGPDSFTFSASDSVSGFPTNPAHAAASFSLAVPGPSVAISGAPSTLYAGTSAQLTATVKYDAPGVVWSVDGVDGGTVGAGTVSAGGLYVAPVKPPPSGSVTIGVRSASAHAETAVQIVDPPAPQPAPSPPAGASSKTTLRAPSVLQNGRLLIVRSGSKLAGRLRITVWSGERKLGSCQARVPAGRSFACQVRLPRGDRIRRARVVVSLRVKHKLIAALRGKVKLGPTGGAASRDGFHKLVCKLVDS